MGVTANQQDTKYFLNQPFILTIRFPCPHYLSLIDMKDLDQVSLGLTPFSSSPCKSLKIPMSRGD